MMTSAECKEAWDEVIRIYKETKDTDPETTMKEIIESIGMEKTKEAFATVAAIKKHDGRIYGTNRKYMDGIPVNPDSVSWEHGNDMRYTDLDYIHTAHINQLITELRKKEA